MDSIYFDGNLLLIHHLNSTDSTEELFLYQVPTVNSQTAAKKITEFIDNEQDYYSYSLRRDSLGNMNLYLVGNQFNAELAILYRYTIYNADNGDVRVFKTQSDLRLGPYCGDFIDSTHTLIILTCLANKMLHVFRRQDSFAFVAHLSLPEGD